MIDLIISEINNCIDESVIPFNKRILQILPSGYGENDILIGVRSPSLRKLSRKYYKNMAEEDIIYFLRSSVHEYRLFAVMVMVLKMKFVPDKIFNLYLNNLDYLNNWDIIDISCFHIIGKYICDNYNSIKQKEFLNDLYDSNNFWHRRITIVSTMYFIKKEKLDFCLNFYKKVTLDPHHLNNKALGWMLREVLKKDKDRAIKFIKQNKLKNITFNYATEKLNKEEKEILRKNNINL